MSAESRVVYRRATPTDTETGIAELRAMEEVRIDLPVDCADSPRRTLECRAEHGYGRAYSLRFRLERRSSTSTGASIELDERGELLLALDFSIQDLEALDRDLRRFVGDLSASRFRRPGIGLVPGTEILAGLSSNSRTPAWACLDLGGSRTASRYDRVVETDSEGNVRVVGASNATYNDARITGPVCNGIGDALDGSAPELLRTLPLALRLVEETVRVEWVDTLLSDAWPDELLQLPEDVEYTQQRDPGVSEGSWGSSGGADGLLRSSQTRDEIKISTAIRPAALPPHAFRENLFRARWVVESIERTTGAMPEERPLGRSELLVALVPTAPPRSLEGETARGDAPHRVAFDREAYLAGVAERIDSMAVLDAGAIGRSSARSPAGLGSQGWLRVTCDPDGTAFYGLVPTSGNAPVTNAQSVCDAIAAGLRHPVGE